MELRTGILAPIVSSRGNRWHPGRVLQPARPARPFCPLLQSVMTLLSPAAHLGKISPRGLEDSWGVNNELFVDLVRHLRLYCGEWGLGEGGGLLWAGPGRGHFIFPHSPRGSRLMCLRWVISCRFLLFRSLFCFVRVETTDLKITG